MAFGRELMGALREVSFEPTPIEIFTTLPHPGVGVTDRGIGGGDHAAAPGLMTLDGWAPALCVDLATSPYTERRRVIRCAPSCAGMVARQLGNRAVGAAKTA